MWRYNAVVTGRKVAHRLSKYRADCDGYRVNIGKSTGDGYREPYAVDDEIDFLVVMVPSGTGDSLTGFFVFPKRVLHGRRYFQDLGQNLEGRTGFTVYPPHVSPPGKRGIENQRWQQDYYIDLHGSNQETGIRRARDLFRGET